MHRFRLISLCFATWAACLAAVTQSWAAGLDDGFATSYAFFPTPQYVYYTTCGANPVGDDGCFGFGRLGPFGRAGCVIEGDAETIANSVTRAIYIVDVDSGGDGVTLYRYLKTDVIDPVTGNDSISSKLTNTVTLPLTGGSNATCVMAGTGNFLYIGTDQTSSVARVKKGALSVSEVIAGSTAFKIKYITADQHGFVSIGSVVVKSGATIFTVFYPNGLLSEQGGGDAFLLTPYSGVSDPPSSP